MDLPTSDYLGSTFIEHENCVRKSCRLLRDVDFDTVVYSGYSGSLVAPVVAFLLKKKLVFVRKPTDVRHSRLLVEGDLSGKRYIIVDDAVETGRTVIRIHDEIHKVRPELKCLGVFTYELPNVSGTVKLRDENGIPTGKQIDYLSAPVRKQLSKLVGV